MEAPIGHDAELAVVSEQTQHRLIPLVTISGWIDNALNVIRAALIKIDVELYQIWQVLTSSHEPLNTLQKLGDQVVQLGQAVTTNTSTITENQQQTQNRFDFYQNPGGNTQITRDASGRVEQISTQVGEFTRITRLQRDVSGAVVEMITALGDQTQTTRVVRSGNQITGLTVSGGIS